MASRPDSAASSSTPFGRISKPGSVIMTRTGFLVVVGCLVVFGLVMLYSASSIYSYNQHGDYSATFFKQILFVAVGIVIALVTAIIPYQKYSLGLCLICLLAFIPLLIYVLVEGNDALGARRWIDIGFTTLQPSEFAKISLMLVLVQLVHRCREDGYSVALVLFMIVACVVPIGLIIVEPDLGTTIIAVTGILAVLWFGGVPKRVVAVLALGLVVAAVVAVTGTGFRQTRITSWLDPWSDPEVSGYQLLSSYYAFGGGGIFGVGLGLSKQKFNWLPQSENDFLFAIIGEELGLLGAMLVVLLFVLLVVMSLRVAANAPDARGAMIAGACGVIISGQAFLNMLCVVGALPTTGKPLPFFSAGGSSIISTMVLVGLILSVSMQSSEEDVYDFRRGQFTIINGGNRRDGAAAGKGSVLSRLPNPAAAVGAMLPAFSTKSTAQERARRAGPETRAASSQSTVSERMANSGRIADTGRSANFGRKAASDRRAGSGRRAGSDRRVDSDRRAGPDTRTGLGMRAGSGLGAGPGTGTVSSRRADPGRRAGSGRRTLSGTAAAPEKVVPISRGKADRSTREAQADRKRREDNQTAASRKREAEAPISLASLRRNRVRSTRSRGRSA